MERHKLTKVFYAVLKSKEFFEHRDQMNSAVHTEEVRWSPITVAVLQAYEILRNEEVERKGKGDE